MSTTAPDSIARRVVEGLGLAGIDTLYCLPGVQNDGVFVEDVTQIGFASHLGFDFRGPLGAQHALSRVGDRRALVVAGDGGFLFTANPDALRKRLEEAFTADGPVVVQVDVGPMPDPWPLFLRGPARRGRGS